VIGRRNRRDRQWRSDPGPRHDLRLFVGGQPTSVVATMAWDHGDRPRPRVAYGPDIQLFREDRRIVLAELRPGHGVVRMQLPIKSCVDASVTEAPGLPGMALLCLTLSVRMGGSVVGRLELWFHQSAQDLLRELVEEIAAIPRPPVESAVLLPLAVRLAPDHKDWVVFRSADDGVVIAEEQL
jgi:hypothetical protein